MFTPYATKIITVKLTSNNFAPPFSSLFRLRLGVFLKIGLGPILIFLQGPPTQWLVFKGPLHFWEQVSLA